MIGKKLSRFDFWKCLSEPNENKAIMMDLCAWKTFIFKRV